MDDEGGESKDERVPHDKVSNAVQKLKVHLLRRVPRVRAHELFHVHLLLAVRANVPLSDQTPTANTRLVK